MEVVIGRSPDWKNQDTERTWTSNPLLESIVIPALCDLIWVNEVLMRLMKTNELTAVKFRNELKDR